MSYLLNFYGEECPHCKKMNALLSRLEKEENISVERIEVWNSDKNLKRMKEYDKKLCGGVPFFYNTETKQWICGEAEYEELKNWALGK